MVKINLPARQHKPLGKIAIPIDSFDKYVEGLVTHAAVIVAARLLTKDEILAGLERAKREVNEGYI